MKLSSLSPHPWGELHDSQEYVHILQETPSFAAKNSESALLPDTHTPGPSCQAGVEFKFTFPKSFSDSL